MSTETIVKTVTSAVGQLSVQPAQADSTSTVQSEDTYKYQHLLPAFDNNKKYAPLRAFDHVDPGHRALSHPNPISFLGNATRVTEMTPNLGTEVEGVQLLSLSHQERDQLALHVARRGLMVFRNQNDFIDSGIDSYREWGSYFGRLHIHPTSGHPLNAPELHLVYRDAHSTFNFELDDRITTTLWHTDVSYEVQPPGLTTFFLVAQPSTGGDTLFVSTVSVLKSLSAQFVAFLRTLKAVHSGIEQADHSRSGKRGGVVRREPVETIHPVIRKHPVTGEEALYINKQFTKGIVGLKREESDNILNFLYDHVAKNGESQARVHWTPGTVVLWDNRVTAHSAIVDYKESKERRHGVRITPQADRPVSALEA
ncbi:TauD-domain-containing protein [Sistotremastrum niveocremeum HHB9708]|uniref:TauD-domain-containing protein n=1 Tax=Sistotremastrum niveocremeum HHB9708 TaxID=1314777 RepID=A0A164XPC4_9AGAM|nr:TauD-domain-containing protein [Sistotremastrum niveocremeum HHB9708]